MNLYMILSSFTAGLLGAMGFGGGSVLIIYLTNFLAYEQKQAQGINLVFFVPCAILSLISYKKNHMVDFKSTLPITALAIVGAVIGFLILDYIPTEILSKIFGAFLIGFGVIQLLGKA